VKPGIGVVAINFSGSFSCAFTVGTHRLNVITQIFNDCRNLSPQKMQLIGPTMRIASMGVVQIVLLADSGGQARGAQTRSQDSSLHSMTSD
jgi:hypothetical protein